LVNVLVEITLKKKGENRGFNTRIYHFIFTYHLTKVKIDFRGDFYLFIVRILFGTW